jgi:transglutaminase-like putative cysteine protease
MRIKVRHETRYTYSEPASSALQLLRMTPRPFDGQFVRRWRIEVDADARLDKDEDAYGNITHLIYVTGPVETVRIVINGEVDTADTSGIIRGTAERLPVRLFLRETPLTVASPAIREMATACLAAVEGDRLAALHRITSEIHRQMTFTIGATSTATSAAESFKSGAGVCQDFAHIFVAAARSLGVPARYVGGYYLRTDMVDQGAGHGWAEAHVDRIGWIGFDPAQGMCLTDRYVRVATGLDYLDASPVRGARFGGAEEALAVAIQIQQGRAIQQE